MNDDDQVAEFLRTKGATILPPREAAAMGETTPGWRRNAERREERKQKRKLEKSEQKDAQR